MTSDSYSVETVADIRETTLQLIEKYEETRNLITLYTDSMNQLFHGQSFIERIQKIDQEFLDVKRKVKKISDLADFMTASAPLLEALPEQTERFNATFAEHQKKLTVLRNRGKELTTRADNLQSQIDEINRRLDAIEEFNREEPERFAALKEEITKEYKALIAKTKEKITEERQEAEHALAAEAAENLRNATAEINERIANVTSAVQDELRRGDADANALIQKLREDLTAAVARTEEAKEEAVKQAADAVMDLRKDMADQKNRTERLDKKHKANA